MKRLSIRSRAPKASSALVRSVMLANYGGNTSPERRLRAALFQSGLRFRKDYRPIAALRCTLDIAFPAKRVGIFVDGCFWHGCPVHFSCPKRNAKWWAEKIGANINRDSAQAKALRKNGWCVIRLWEHDLTPKQLSKAVRRVRGALSH